MIQEFTSYLSSTRNMSPHTVRAYEKDLREFAKWAQNNMEGARWSTMTQQDIDQYQQWQTEQGRKSTTINRHLSSIKAFYKYLMRQGLIKSNPLRYAAYQQQEKTVPNVIDIASLERATETATGTLRIMLLILTETGVRVQELLDIEQTDIETDRIRIHGKGRKERYVYMKSESIAEVKDWTQGRGQRIFGDITQRDVRRAIYIHLRRYSTDKQLSPHAIRHTFASKLAKNGAPTATISKLLGHEHISTAEKYINLNDQSTREQYIQFS